MLYGSQQQKDVLYVIELNFLNKRLHCSLIFLNEVKMHRRRLGGYGGLPLKYFLSPLWVIFNIELEL